jgi:hypothetical protein
VLCTRDGCRVNRCLRAGLCWFQPPSLASVGPSKVKDPKSQSRPASCCCTCIYPRVVSCKEFASRSRHTTGQKSQPEAMGKTFSPNTCAATGLVAVIRFPAAIPSSFPRESLHVIAKSRNSPGQNTSLTSLALSRPPVYGHFASYFLIRTIITCLA